MCASEFFNLEWQMIDPFYVSWDVPSTYSWNCGHSVSAELHLQDAAAYFEDFHQVQPWGSLIWVIYSFSVLLWRLFYNHLNTQDNLWRCGFFIVSCCPLCKNDAEMASHLFLGCPYAQHLWRWLVAAFRWWFPVMVIFSSFGIWSNFLPFLFWMLLFGVLPPLLW